MWQRKRQACFSSQVAENQIMFMSRAETRKMPSFQKCPVTIHVRFVSKLFLALPAAVASYPRLPSPVMVRDLRDQLRTDQPPTKLENRCAGTLPDEVGSEISAGLHKMMDHLVVCATSTSRSSYGGWFPPGTRNRRVLKYSPAHCFAILSVCSCIALDFNSAAFPTK
jgi:hypothetical protein